MGVLDVVHGVVVALRGGEVDVEGELGVGGTGGQEVAGGIAAHFIDEVPQGDITAGALGQLYLLAIAHHRYHLVQHILRPALGNAAFQRL